MATVCLYLLLRFSQLNSGNKFNTNYIKRVKFFLNIYVEHFWKLPPGPSRHDRPDIVSHISSLFITYVNKENYTGKFETNLLQRIRKCVRIRTSIYRVGAMVSAQMLDTLCCDHILYTPIVELGQWFLLRC